MNRHGSSCLTRLVAVLVAASMVLTMPGMAAWAQSLMDQNPAAQTSPDSAVFPPLPEFNNAGSSRPELNAHGIATSKNQNQLPTEFNTILKDVTDPAGVFARIASFMADRVGEMATAKANPTWNPNLALGKALSAEPLHPVQVSATNILPPLPTFSPVKEPQLPSLAPVSLPAPVPVYSQATRAEHERVRLDPLIEKEVQEIHKTVTQAYLQKLEEMQKLRGKADEMEMRAKQLIMQEQMDQAQGSMDNASQQADEALKQAQAAAQALVNGNSHNAALEDLLNSDLLKARDQLSQTNNQRNAAVNNLTQAMQIWQASRAKMLQNIASVRKIEPKVADQMEASLKKMDEAMAKQFNTASQKLKTMREDIEKTGQQINQAADLEAQRKKAEEEANKPLYQKAWDGIKSAASWVWNHSGALLETAAGITLTVLGTALMLVPEPTLTKLVGGYLISVGGGTLAAHGISQLINDHSNDQIGDLVNKEGAYQKAVGDEQDFLKTQNPKTLDAYRKAMNQSTAAQKDFDGYLTANEKSGNLHRMAEGLRASSDRMGRTLDAVLKDIQHIRAMPIGESTAELRRYANDIERRLGNAGTQMQNEASANGLYRTVQTLNTALASAKSNLYLPTDTAAQRQQKDDAFDRFKIQFEAMHASVTDAWKDRYQAESRYGWKLSNFDKDVVYSTMIASAAGKGPGGVALSALGSSFHLLTGPVDVAFGGALTQMGTAIGTLGYGLEQIGLPTGALRTAGDYLKMTGISTIGNSSSFAALTDMANLRTGDNIHSDYLSGGDLSSRAFGADNLRLQRDEKTGNYQLIDAQGQRVSNGQVSPFAQYWLEDKARTLEQQDIFRAPNSEPLRITDVFGRSDIKGATKLLAEEGGADYAADPSLWNAVKGSAKWLASTTLTGVKTALDVFALGGIGEAVGGLGEAGSLLSRVSNVAKAIPETVMSVQFAGSMIQSVKDGWAAYQRGDWAAVSGETSNLAGTILGMGGLRTVTRTLAGEGSGGAGGFMKDLSLDTFKEGVRMSLEVGAGMLGGQLAGGLGEIGGITGVSQGLRYAARANAVNDNKVDGALNALGMGEEAWKAQPELKSDAIDILAQQRLGVDSDGALRVNGRVVDGLDPANEAVKEAMAQRDSSQSALGKLRDTLQDGWGSLKETLFGVKPEKIESTTNETADPEWIKSLRQKLADLPKQQEELVKKQEALDKDLEKTPTTPEEQDAYAKKVAERAATRDELDSIRQKMVDGQKLVEEHDQEAKDKLDEIAALRRKQLLNQMKGKTREAAEAALARQKAELELARQSLERLDSEAGKAAVSDHEGTRQTLVRQIAQQELAVAQMDYGLRNNRGNLVNVREAQGKILDLKIEEQEAKIKKLTKAKEEVSNRKIDDQLTTEARKVAEAKKAADIAKAKAELELASKESAWLKAQRETLSKATEVVKSPLSPRARVEAKKARREVKEAEEQVAVAQKAVVKAKRVEDLARAKKDAEEYQKQMKENVAANQEAIQQMKNLVGDGSKARAKVKEIWSRVKEKAKDIATLRDVDQAIRDVLQSHMEDAKNGRPVRSQEQLTEDIVQKAVARAETRAKQALAEAALEAKDAKAAEKTVTPLRRDRTVLHMVQEMVGKTMAPKKFMEQLATRVRELHGAEKAADVVREVDYHQAVEEMAVEAQRLARLKGGALTTAELNDLARNAADRAVELMKERVQAMDAISEKGKARLQPTDASQRLVEEANSRLAEINTGATEERLIKVTSQHVDQAISDVLADLRRNQARGAALELPPDLEELVSQRAADLALKEAAKGDIPVQAFGGDAIERAGGIQAYVDEAARGLEANQIMADLRVQRAQLELQAFDEKISTKELSRQLAALDVQEALAVAGERGAILAPADLARVKQSFIRRIGEWFRRTLTGADVSEAVKDVRTALENLKSKVKTGNAQEILNARDRYYDALRRLQGFQGDEAYKEFQRNNTRAVVVGRGRQEINLGMAVERLTGAERDSRINKAKEALGVEYFAAGLKDGKIQFSWGEDGKTPVWEMSETFRDRMNAELERTGALHPQVIGEVMEHVVKQMLQAVIKSEGLNGRKLTDKEINLITNFKQWNKVQSAANIDLMLAGNHLEAAVSCGKSYLALRAALTRLYMDPSNGAATILVRSEKALEQYVRNYGNFARAFGKEMVDLDQLAKARDWDAVVRAMEDSNVITVATWTELPQLMNEAMHSASPETRAKLREFLARETGRNRITIIDEAQDFLSDHVEAIQGGEGTPIRELIPRYRPLYDQLKAVVNDLKEGEDYYRDGDSIWLTAETRERFRKIGNQEYSYSDIQGVLRATMEAKTDPFKTVNIVDEGEMTGAIVPRGDTAGAQPGRILHDKPFLAAKALQFQEMKDAGDQRLKDKILDFDKTRAGGKTVAAANPLSLLWKLGGQTSFLSGTISHMADAIEMLTGGRVHIVGDPPRLGIDNGQGVRWFNPRGQNIGVDYRLKATAEEAFDAMVKQAADTLVSRMVREGMGNYEGLGQWIGIRDVSNQGVKFEEKLMKELTRRAIAGEVKVLRALGLEGLSPEEIQAQVASAVKKLVDNKFEKIDDNAVLKAGVVDQAARAASEQGKIVLVSPVGWVGIDVKGHNLRLMAYEVENNGRVLMEQLVARINRQMNNGDYFSKGQAVLFSSEEGINSQLKTLVDKYGAVALQKWAGEKEYTEIIKKVQEGTAVKPEELDASVQVIFRLNQLRENSETAKMIADRVFNELLVKDPMRDFVMKMEKKYGVDSSQYKAALRIYQEKVLDHTSSLYEEYVTGKTSEGKDILKSKLTGAVAQAEKLEGLVKADRALSKKDLKDFRETFRMEELRDVRARYDDIGANPAMSLNKARSVADLVAAVRRVEGDILPGIETTSYAPKAVAMAQAVCDKIAKDQPVSDGEIRSIRNQALADLKALERLGSRAPHLVAVLALTDNPADLKQVLSTHLTPTGSDGKNPYTFWHAVQTARKQDQGVWRSLFTGVAQSVQQKFKLAPPQAQQTKFAMDAYADAKKEGADPKLVALHQRNLDRLVGKADDETSATMEKYLKDNAKTLDPAVRADLERFRDMAQSPLEEGDKGFGPGVVIHREGDVITVRVAAGRNGQLPLTAQAALLWAGRFAQAFNRNNPAPVRVQLEVRGSRTAALQGEVQQLHDTTSAAVPEVVFRAPVVDRSVQMTSTTRDRMRVFWQNMKGDVRNPARLLGGQLGAVRKTLAEIQKIGNDLKDQTSPRASAQKMSQLRDLQTKLQAQMAALQRSAVGFVNVVDKGTPFGAMIHALAASVTDSAKANQIVSIFLNQAAQVQGLVKDKETGLINLNEIKMGQALPSDFLPQAPVGAKVVSYAMYAMGVGLAIANLPLWGILLVGAGKMGLQALLNKFMVKRSLATTPLDKPWFAELAISAWKSKPMEAVKNSIQTVKESRPVKAAFSGKMGYVTYPIVIIAAVVVGVWVMGGAMTVVPGLYSALGKGFISMSFNKLPFLASHLSTMAPAAAMAYMSKFALAFIPFALTGIGLLSLLIRNGISYLRSYRHFNWEALPVSESAPQSTSAKADSTVVTNPQNDAPMVSPVASEKESPQVNAGQQTSVQGSSGRSYGNRKGPRRNTSRDGYNTSARRPSGRKKTGPDPLEEMGYRTSRKPRPVSPARERGPRGGSIEIPEVVGAVGTVVKYGAPLGLIGSLMTLGARHADAALKLSNGPLNLDVFTEFILPSLLVGIVLTVIVGSVALALQGAKTYFHTRNSSRQENSSDIPSFQPKSSTPLPGEIAPKRRAFWAQA